MKTTKRILVAIVACAAMALIAMAGTVPAALRQSTPADMQAQIETQQPEMIPGVPIESITIDSIFR
jgi:hypothetical protein